MVIFGEFVKCVIFELGVW